MVRKKKSKPPSPQHTFSLPQLHYFIDYHFLSLQAVQREREQRIVDSPQQVISNSSVESSFHAFPPLQCSVSMGHISLSSYPTQTISSSSPPTAGHCWAWPPRWGCLGENVLKKGEETPLREERTKKKSTGYTEGREEGGEEVLQVRWKRLPCSPWRDHGWQIPTLQPVDDHTPQHVCICWKDCGLWNLTLQNGKSMNRRTLESSVNGLTTVPLCLHSSFLSEWYLGNAEAVFVLEISYSFRKYRKYCYRCKEEKHFL